MPKPVFDVERTAEIIPRIGLELEAHRDFIVDIELGAHRRIIKDGAGLRLIRTRAKSLFQGPPLQGKAPILRQIVLNRIDHGKDDLK